MTLLFAAFVLGKFWGLTDAVTEVLRRDWHRRRHSFHAVCGVPCWDQHAATQEQSFCV